MYQQYGKRVLDVVVAGVALLVCAPLLLCLCPWVYVSNGGTILFRQQRPGLHGRPFYLYKLQTMAQTRTPAGKLLPDDQRLTEFGKWLRQLSLDELPQFYNVLRGDLSLVGPRPLLMEYLPLYSPEQARRHSLKPGITGWAQVHGRNNISWEQKFRLDLWYVDHISFSTDAFILLKTIKRVVLRQDIQMAGHATAPRFTGSNVPA
ncbi:sugar transferase [Pontibacter chitinilyticus]|uniref:sugar transferase n=1 Tax=Pontibacter chitinilyticus TaxID=2674989 RepID=UPI00321BBFBB